MLYVYQQVIIKTIQPHGTDHVAELFLFFGGTPLLKKGEVDAAVMAVFNKAGMLAEVVVLAMLYYQETVFAQKIAFEYHIRQFGYFLQYIGRVCKDEVELLPALTDVLEHISLYGDCRKVLKLVYELLDELEVQRILLYAYDT